jgi:hypothetical protein
MTETVRNASVRVAAAMDRKRFVRRFAGAVFTTASLLSVGKLINPSAAYGYTSDCLSPTGGGCPTGCGPSDCCYIGGRPSGCQCGTGTNCLDNGAHCHGYAQTWGGDSCWTCYWQECGGGHILAHTTTCCDCATTGCNDDSGHCISFQSTITHIGECDGPSSRPTSMLPKPVVVGVYTGDRATSWGIR